ncbi:MAG: GntR family transcriptional regulator [Burkholderiales bacterium]|nr:GntR family transcriptional regulator [Burkholderiales bacterium]
MLPSDKFHAAFAAPDGEPRTLTERAYLVMRSDIVAGRLPPGQRLRVEHLKDRYEVGAGTLREALGLLVSDALVQAEGQRGFRVAPMSLADLEDVTENRVFLETEALRQSIRRGDATWEAALVEAFERLSQAERARDMAERERCNRAFHEALIAAHDSRWNKYMLGILYRHAERYRLLAMRLVDMASLDRDVHREHEDIFKAAMARQGARAALALEAHVRLTCELLQAEVRRGLDLQAALANLLAAAD